MKEVRDDLRDNIDRYEDHSKREIQTSIFFLNRVIFRAEKL